MTTIAPKLDADSVVLSDRITTAKTKINMP